MAFKRSAVRSRLSPPKSALSTTKSAVFERKQLIFFACHSSAGWLFFIFRRMSGYPHRYHFQWLYDSLGLLCGERGIQPIEKLLIAEVKGNGHLITSSHIHSLDQLIDNHFLGSRTGAVKQLCPGDQFIILLRNGLQLLLTLFHFRLRRLSGLFQSGAFCFPLRNHGCQHFF